MANDKVEKRLDGLKALRAVGDTPEFRAALGKALTDRVNLVAAKAAQMAGELRIAALVPDLQKAFDRLLRDGAKSDPQCWGKNAISKALKDLEFHESALFVRGIRHIQLEPVWAGNEDTAAVLRGTCAAALVQCTDIPRDEILRHLVDALTESAVTVRVDAARSMEQMGGREAVLLLRLKARCGDSDPRVTGQALECLMQLEGEASIEFVAGFLKAQNEEVQEEAALALGTSRLSEALALLKESWTNTRGHPAFLLRAISVSRQDEALEFLLELISKGRPREAQDALYALEIHRDSEDIVKRVSAAVAKRGDADISAVFSGKFLSK